MFSRKSDTYIRQNFAWDISKDKCVYNTLFLVCRRIEKLFTSHIRSTTYNVVLGLHMKKGEFFLTVLSLLIVGSTCFVLGASDIFESASVTSSSWEGTGEGTVIVATPPAPRITSVIIDKKSITPEYWVTVTVEAVNDAGTSGPGYGHIHIGLPWHTWDPISIGDVLILDHNFNDYCERFAPGSELGGGYGQYKITSQYTMVEGGHKDWTTETLRLSIRVKIPDTDTVAFDVKSVAHGAGEYRYDPNSGMIDQQDEYVRPYLILRKFTVSVAPGGTAQEVSISIINHGRSPSKKTQPSMTVPTDGFTVTNWGGFSGTIEATNLPLAISPGTTGTLKISVSAPSTHPLGTYTIQYKVSGTP